MIFETAVVAPPATAVAVPNPIQLVPTAATNGPATGQTTVKAVTAKKVRNPAPAVISPPSVIFNPPSITLSKVFNLCTSILFCSQNCLIFSYIFLFSSNCF